MIEQAIVAFIDILGYTKLIENHFDNLDNIKSLENVLTKSIEGLKEIIRNKQFSNDLYDELKNNIVNIIRNRLISDTVIFTLPISKIDYTNPADKNTTITDSIVLYFYFISMFITLFLSHTGCLMRGGIAIGPHYESDLGKGGGNFFIFSKAYVDAYSLENIAKNPRIIVDEHLISYLKKQSFTEMNRFIYRDKGGKHCFNIYGHITHIDHNYKTVLNVIKKTIENQIIIYAHDKKISRKLKYFAKYHNKKVGEKDLNCSFGAYRGREK